MSAVGPTQHIDPNWRLSVQPSSCVEFNLANTNEVGAQADGRLWFDIPAGEHRYLLTEGSHGVGRVPERSALPMAPGRRQTLHGSSLLEGKRARARLWVIWFDDAARLGHATVGLRDERFSLTWTAEDEARHVIVALRLSGTGVLALRELQLEVGDVGQPRESELYTGPRGGFRLPSAFGDPLGYLPMTARHRRHYAGRGSSWYAKVVAPLRGRRRVLDVGGGPGLLAAALRDIGVAEVDLLERDSRFAAEAASAGTRVIQHDLEWPFPFLETGSYDGAVAHQVLDYLAPRARRATIYELARVLAPGGLLVADLQLQGPARGDPARPEPVDAAALIEDAQRAGFAGHAVERTERAVHLELVRDGTAAPGAFSGDVVKLPNGVEVRPWGTASRVLGADPDAWDELSRRDFTLLTDPAKREVRLREGARAAVYTGYRAVGEETARSVCLAVSGDGLSWERRGALLEAGPAGSWDSGGVAAGSLIARDAEPGWWLYYTGRDGEGRWVGIGTARVESGSATRVSGPLLADAFPGVEHLALADVLRRADGTWLMHLEGMREGRWGVYQARSADGAAWAPAQERPVLSGEMVSWAGVDAANPKCVELEGGLLVMGFNGAGPGRNFQLGLATSYDGKDWQTVGRGPVRSPRAGEHRLESLFMTRDEWERGTRRAYFFAASSAATHRSSDVLAAEADHGSTWPGEPWVSRRLDLYRVSGGGLRVDPGATGEGHDLSARWPLEGEIECAGAIAEGAAGGGALTIAVRGRDGRRRTLLDTSELATGERLAWSVRLMHAAQGAEVASRAWIGAELVHDEQGPLELKPPGLEISVAAPPDGDGMVVDHLRVEGQHEVVTVAADAHVYAGVPRGGDPLMPDISAERLLEALREEGVGRALAVPYGAARRLDGFDELGRAADLEPGVVYPLIRLRPIAAELSEWTVDQLELSWQLGRLYGLKTHMAVDPLPPPEVLAWLTERELPSLWHVASSEHLASIEADVLPHLESPVLLSHFGGYPADRRRYQAALEMLDRWPQLYLVTSMVWMEHYLRAAITAHPDRVLMGSDYPAVKPRVARAAIEALGLPGQDRTRVLGENLRFLLGRAVRVREQALVNRDLRFPRPPVDGVELNAQGFELVPAGELPASEPDAARRFWAERGVRSWYREHKPWATLVADLAADLAPASVLEFGCNLGRNLAAVRDAVPGARLKGLDVNADAVEAGKAEHRLDLEAGDEDGLGRFADGEFDLVFTVSVLDHMAEVDRVIAELVRCSSRAVFMLEVSLPAEGKVSRHFDHAAGQVRASTGASYSWDLETRLRAHQRVWRLDHRPVYLHDRSLGPYYASYLAWLESPAAEE